MASCRTLYVGEQAVRRLVPLEEEDLVDRRRPHRRHQRLDRLIAPRVARPARGCEETALKRLAMYDGALQSKVDDLLREGRLVDLYKVVGESVHTSEPGYLIKNMEKFYLDGGPIGGVKRAGTAS